MDEIDIFNSVLNIYKYDAKQLAAGEDKQQDTWQLLLEERTLGSDRQAELVDESNLWQTKCENKLCLQV